MDEKEKTKFVAIIRRLQKDKGFTIKNHAVKGYIDELKKKQNELKEIKEENPDSAAVQDEADKGYKQLQSVVDDLNSYMAVLHPEGLIDYGGANPGTPGGKVMGSG